VLKRENASGGGFERLASESRFSVLDEFRCRPIALGDGSQNFCTAWASPYGGHVPDEIGLVWWHTEGRAQPTKIHASRTEEGSLVRTVCGIALPKSPVEVLPPESALYRLSAVSCHACRRALQLGAEASK
jgi:hypothetical protein